MLTFFIIKLFLLMMLVFLATVVKDSFVLAIVHDHRNGTYQWLLVSYQWFPLMVPINGTYQLYLSLVPITSIYHWYLSLVPITGIYHWYLLLVPITGTYKWLLSMVPITVTY